MYARRLVYLFLTIKTFSILVALISAHFLYPYSSSTELLLSGSTNQLDSLIRKYLSPFASWDAAYFLRIATHGYELEHQHAFFPLYPLLLRLGASLLCGVGIPTLTGCLIVGFLLSNLCHFLTVVNIFRYFFLEFQILNNHRISISLGADDYFAFLSSAFAIISLSFPFQTAMYNSCLNFLDHLEL